MADYIEREALLWEIGEEYDFAYGEILVDPYEFARMVEYAPAADVAPVVHGRWVGLEYDGYADGCPVYDLWECSKCGEEVSGEDVPQTHNYCPNCGAHMKDGDT